MSAPQKGSSRVSHLLIAIVALGLIFQHFLTYGEMYQEIFTEGLSLSGIGTGKVLMANIVIFFSIFGALLISSSRIISVTRNTSARRMI